MPKQVDIHQRRLLIAGALQRVVGERGLEGVSLRTVANAAGVSMGLVQHYFSTKEDMLLFALDAIEEQIGQRYATMLASAPEPPGARQTVQALLEQSLPIDEQRRQECLTILLAGLQNASVGMRIRGKLHELARFVEQSIEAAGAPDVDPRKATNELIALNEGLGIMLLGGYLSTDEARTILGNRLDLLFTRT